MEVLFIVDGPDDCHSWYLLNAKALGWAGLLGTVFMNCYSNVPPS